jgi:branched-chain amino acid transport system permease protein
MDTNFARSRRRDLIVAFCLAAIAAVVPLFVKDSYVQNIMVLTLMWGALSQSWNILSGYCGQISLGHALYFGIGAYTTTLLFTKFGVLPWFGMVGGGLISAVIAMALGYPCFRLRGHYFVIATIVIAEIGLLLFHNWDWAGAAMGIEIPVRGDSWLKFQFPRSKLPYFYFALALACVAWFVTWWLEDSKWGYWWRAVKDNPDAAESLGVVVFNSKMGAAAVSAFLVAVGGSFYAQFVSYIDPESIMGFHISLLMALPAVLGGIGTLWGPMLGAVILIPLTELTRSFIGGSGRGVDLIVYGGLIIAISLAIQLKEARIIATDVAPAALELAKRNAEKHGVADRIEFRQGSLLEPLSEAGHGGVRFDAICTNPPYISDAEWADVPSNVKDYEPASALRGGKDGLDYIGPLIAQSPELLASGGKLVIEIADSQRDAAIELASGNPLLANTDVLKDHEGLSRVLVAERQ